MKLMFGEYLNVEFNIVRTLMIFLVTMLGLALLAEAICLEEESEKMQLLHSFKNKTLLY